MERHTHITTAANSKTMNAIENIKLFAAAGETESIINAGDLDKHTGAARPSHIGSAGKTPGKKKGRPR